MLWKRELMYNRDRRCTLSRIHQQLKFNVRCGWSSWFGLRSEQAENDDLLVEQSDQYDYQIPLTPATVVYELDGKITHGRELYRGLTALVLMRDTDGSCR